MSLTLIADFGIWVHFWMLKWLYVSLFYDANNFEITNVKATTSEHNEYLLSISNISFLYLLSAYVSASIPEESTSLLIASASFNSGWPIWFLFTIEFWIFRKCFWIHFYTKRYTRRRYRAKRRRASTITCQVRFHVVIHTAAVMIWYGLRNVLRKNRFGVAREISKCFYFLGIAIPPPLRKRLQYLI